MALRIAASPPRARAAQSRESNQPQDTGSQAWVVVLAAAFFRIA